jgi:hypothetical protein
LTFGGISKAVAEAKAAAEAKAKAEAEAKAAAEKAAAEKAAAEKAAAEKAAAYAKVVLLANIRQCLACVCCKSIVCKNQNIGRDAIFKICFSISCQKGKSLAWFCQPRKSLCI